MFHFRLDSPSGTQLTKFDNVSIDYSNQNNLGQTTIFLNNVAGQYSGTFAVGNNVLAYLSTGSPPTSNMIFNGFIHQQEFISYPNQREILTLKCLDHNSRLAEVTHNEAYSNLYAGSIIKAMIAKDVSGITVTNVDDGIMIKHIAFRHKPVNECIKELAEISDFDFYIDTAKDLHFKSEKTVSTGSTLIAGTDITDAKIKEDRSMMFNKIYVIGGKRLVGYAQSGLGDGAGSVFTLSYKPHDTFVTVSGAEKVGGIFEMAINPSGIQYLIDYDNKQLIFTQSVNCGSNIPGSLVEWKCEYQRLSPVAKKAEDSASIASYGERRLVVVNEEIVQPMHATKVARSLLNKYKNPGKNINLTVKGYPSFVPNQTVGIVYPFANISGTYKINDIHYNITTDSLQAEEAISIEVGDRSPDVTDALKQAYSDIQLLKASPIGDVDVVTHLLDGAGSITEGIYSWTVKKRSIGNSFIMGHPTNSCVGSFAGSYYVFGSGGYTAWTNQVSGGDWS